MRGLPYFLFAARRRGAADLKARATGACAGVDPADTDVRWRLGRGAAACSPSCCLLFWLMCACERMSAGPCVSSRARPAAAPEGRTAVMARGAGVGVCGAGGMSLLQLNGVVLICVACEQTGV